MASNLDGIDLLILVLASYRLTHVLVFDKIAEPVRNRIPGHGYLAYLVRCYWCAGVWISAMLIGLVAITPTVGRWTVLIFAVAGGQAALETAVRLWSKEPD